MKPPDLDCVIYADLGDLEEYQLKLESQHSQEGTVYYRFRFGGTSEQRVKLERMLTTRFEVSTFHCSSVLHKANNNFFFTQYLTFCDKRKLEHDCSSVPWLVQLEDGDLYLSADNIRNLQESLGAEFGAERSATGAAATTALPVRARLDCFTKPSDISHLTKFWNLNFGFCDKLL